MNNVLRQAGLMVFALSALCCQLKGNTVSPNGKLKVVIQTPQSDTYGGVSFSVDYEGKRMLHRTTLGLETNKQQWTDNMKLKSVSKARRITDDYRMITGKRSRCRNRATEQTYSFVNRNGQNLEVTFRVYDDGIAFQYGIHAAEAGELLLGEHTAYTIPGQAKRWIQPYSIGYEGFYPLATSGTPAKPHKVNKWGYPGLVELQDSVFMLMTEANIRRGHCGSFLYNDENADVYKVGLSNKQLPVQGEWVSPWRLLIMGSLSDIVESTLVTDVSDPSVIKNTDWIHPGPVSWVYWAYNHGSKDYRTVKEYIDLAVAMKWPYNLIDWEWDVMENGGGVEDAVKYARERNVKSLLWYNSSTHWLAPKPLYRLNKHENRVKEYKWLNDLGVSGIKVDFFADDSVAMMDYYIDILEDAARYKLLVNFHGATIPRGWQRTYPNLMSYEAVYGAEWYNNKPILTDKAAVHNATLPFTRNVIGSMDYTPGTFSDSQHPHITSHGHELALPVLFESALQHMPDRPSAYYSLPEPVKRLLSGLPTAWDDTKLLEGYPGETVVMARRKGNIWYIAGINGLNEARTLNVNLQSIAKKGKKISLFMDGDTQRSFSIKENMPLPKNGRLAVDCLPRGGFVAVIK